MCSTWWRAVLREITRRSAISAWVSPSATSLNTSISRGVSPAGSCGGRRHVVLPRIGRRRPRPHRAGPRLPRLEGAPPPRRRGTQAGAVVAPPGFGMRRPPPEFGLPASSRFRRSHAGSPNRPAARDARLRAHPTGRGIGQGEDALAQVRVKPNPFELRGRQRAGLVPDRVRDAEAAQIVHEAGATDRVHSSAGNPYSRAAAAASSATPRECPRV